MAKKISNLLSEYFQPDLHIDRSHISSSAFEKPVKATSCTWEVHTDPERFAKKFKFESRQRAIDFVNEVFHLEDEMNHHGDLKIMYDEVMIEVYTHNVNRITELDQEYIRSVDFIYKDVLDFDYR